MLETHGQALEPLVKNEWSFTETLSLFNFCHQISAFANVKDTPGLFGMGSPRKSMIPLNQFTQPV